MDDRTLFSAGPALERIGKRQSKERDARERTLLYPGESTIRRVIGHPAFSDDPTGLRVGKADTKQIRQPRTGP